MLMCFFFIIKILIYTWQNPGSLTGPPPPSFNPPPPISPLVHSVFIVHEGGRPNGIAFVEFPTPQEASAAMVKNKQMMGSRYVEIFPANRTDLERYRARG